MERTKNGEIILTKEEIGKYTEMDYKKTNLSYLKVGLDKFMKKSKDDTSGSWDLYDKYVGENTDEEEIHIRDEENNLYVGTRKYNYVRKYFIDFGTKSTVVGRVDPENKMILNLEQLGVPKLGIEHNDKIYENPTVLYFNDIKKFLADYGSFNSSKEEDRRPKTEHEDLMFSHNAVVEIENLSDKGVISSASYFKNIKQWANSSKSFVVDNKNNYIDIKKIDAFKKVENIEFNPITVYFYLVGAILHNNSTKNLTYSYGVSYPSSTKKVVRQTINTLIKEGLFKNYPKHCTLSESDTKINLAINPIATEPAAYSVTAFDYINAYKGKPVFFSVFDFGGGTSDYFYGLYTEKDKMKAIQSIFNYGDRRLGGEYLIRQLAYKLILSPGNPQKLIDGNIRVYKMFNESHIALDKITDTNSISIANENQLLKFMRPIWEHYDEFKKVSEENEMVQLIFNNVDYTPFIKNKLINIQLTDITGTPVQISLEFNFDELIKKIEKKIRIGVKNFIHGLELSKNIITNQKKLDECIEKCPAKRQIKFDYYYKSDTCYETLDKVIFLAGHSSKSELFRKILKEELENAGLEKEFKVFEPLDIYNDILNKLGVNNDDEVELYKIKEQEKYFRNKYRKNIVDALIEKEFNRSLLPNAKTGVLYGIDRLATETENYVLYSEKAKNEIPFIYNIIDSNNKSYINFATEYKYNVSDDEKHKTDWVEYKKLGEYFDGTSEIKYTDIQYQNEATKDIEDLIESNQIKPKDIYVDNYDVDSEELNLYIRVIDSNTIEWRVCEEIPSNDEAVKKDNVVILGEEK